MICRCSIIVEGTVGYFEFWIVRAYANMLL
jgi:hypothetical protein